MKLDKVFFTSLLAVFMGFTGIVQAMQTDQGKYKAIVATFPPKVNQVFNALVKNKQKLNVTDNQLLNAAQVIKVVLDKKKPVDFYELRATLPSLKDTARFLTPLVNAINAYSKPGAQELVTATDEWLKEFKPEKTKHTWVKGEEYTLSGQIALLVKELSPQALKTLAKAINTAMQQQKAQVLVNFFKRPPTALKREINLQQLAALGFEFPRFIAEFKKYIKAQVPVVRRELSRTIRFADGRTEKIRLNKINAGWGTIPTSYPPLIVRLKYITNKGGELAVVYISDPTLLDTVKSSLGKKYPRSRNSERYFMWDKAKQQYSQKS